MVGFQASPCPFSTQGQLWPVTCGSLEAQAEVGVVTVLAGAPVAARLAVAFINVGFTVMACVARLAEAGKGGHAILAGTIVAGVGVTLINVHLAVGPCVTWTTGRVGTGERQSQLLPQHSAGHPRGSQ